MAISKDHKALSLRRAPNYRLLLVVLIAVVCGSYLLIVTHAATPTSSIESEDGTRIGAVAMGSDSRASGGSYVKFGQTNTSGSPSTTEFHTCYPYAFCAPGGAQVKINGVNIRNVGTYSGSTICSSDWAGFSARGFNAVRLAVNWADVEPTQGTFIFTKIDDAVSRAKAAGLYVIVDGIHTTTSPTNNYNLPSWTLGTDSIDKVSFGGSAYWSALATHFKDDPKVIAYDLMNEPQPTAGGLDQNKAWAMYNTLINSVRSADPDKIVIIEPITGASSLASVNWSLLSNKSNVVVSFHDYFAGGDDDGFGASGYSVGNFVYDGTTGYADSSIAQAQMAAHVSTELAWLSPQRLPLYIGEYGIGTSVAGNTAWLAGKTTIFNTNDLPRTYWEGCSQGTMALYNNVSKTWANYDYPAIFNWK